MYSPSADMASICQSSSTCVSQLQTLSSKYKSTAGCSTDYQAQSVQAWLLQIKYGCVKDGSKYCATTWASATDLSYKDLCSSACFSQYRTIYQEVYGASEAEYLNMVCQKDSKGNYCMDTMTSSETAMSGSMICSECGALMIKMSQSSGASIADSSVDIDTVYGAMCSKDGDSYCFDKFIAAALSTGASGSSSSETCDGTSSTCTNVCKNDLKTVNDIGCCAGSMLAAIPESKKEAENAAKLCSQSLPKPCGAGPSFNLKIEISNLKQSWYAANKATADPLLATDMNSAFGTTAGQAKMGASTAGAGGTSIDVSITTANKDQGTAVENNIKKYKARRSGSSLSLATTSTNLPSDAKIDPSKALSVTVSSYVKGSSAASRSLAWSVLSVVVLNVLVVGRMGAHW